MQAIFAKASAEEGSDFVVFGAPARLTQPGKSPLHNLALGQRLKTVALSFAHFSKVLGRVASIASKRGANLEGQKYRLPQFVLGPNAMNRGAK
ncbi:hypothetical protein QB898_02800 [Ottowia sp. 10c7w1]|uniref:Uncharacterized protein n=1 Tax=Ottowia cancrivicina TaxID=3040346 RepID=A0AAW6RJ71_9BURK|nr:hypothetical protein [Ottowia sp. 10c7w1]